MSQKQAVACPIEIEAGPFQRAEKRKSENILVDPEDKLILAPAKKTRITLDSELKQKVLKFLATTYNKVITKIYPINHAVKIRNITLSIQPTNIIFST